MVLHAQRATVHHADMRRRQQIVGEVEIGSDDIARRRSSTYRARAVHEGVERAIGCIATQAGAACHGIDHEIAAGAQLIDPFEQEIRAAFQRRERRRLRDRARIRRALRSQRLRRPD